VFFWIGFPVWVLKDGFEIKHVTLVDFPQSHERPERIKHILVRSDRLLDLLCLHFTFLADSIDQRDFLIDFHDDFPPFEYLKILCQNLNVAVSRLFGPEPIQGRYFVLDFQLFLGPVNNTLNEIELLTDFIVVNVFHCGLPVIKINDSI
jgi:hypothetical protein